MSINIFYQSIAIHLLLEQNKSLDISIGCSCNEGSISPEITGVDVAFRYQKFDCFV
jgi:hypothetical protein